MNCSQAYMDYTYTNWVIFPMAVKGKKNGFVGNHVTSPLTDLHKCFYFLLSLGDHYNPNNCKHGGMFDKEKVEGYIILLII